MKLLVVLCVTWMACTLTDASCSADVSWTQRTPVMDSMFGVAPGIQPIDMKKSHTTKVEWKLTGDTTCRNASSASCSSTCALWGEALSRPLGNVGWLAEIPNVPLCTLTSSNEQHADFLSSQWQLVGPLILSSRIEHQTRIVFDGAHLSILFSNLPVGVALVLPETSTLRCDVHVSWNLQHGERLSTVIVPLTLSIRSSPPEMVLTAGQFVLPTSLTHIHARRTGKSIPADVQETSLFQEGLIVRIALSGDALVLPLSEACLKRLGESARRVVAAFSDDADDEVANQDDVGADRAACLLERTLLRDQLLHNLTRRFRCDPLPCLHANPVFNTSRLALGASSDRHAIEANVSWLRGGQGFRDAAFVAAQDVLEVPTQQGNTEDAHPVDITKEIDNVVRRWRGAFEGMPTLLQTSDITVVEDSYLEWRITPEQLIARGFQLPTVSQLCWWWATVGTTPYSNAWDAACRDQDRTDRHVTHLWTQALSSKEFGDVQQYMDGGGMMHSRFQIRFDADGLETRKSVHSGVTPFVGGARLLLGGSHRLEQHPYPTTRYRVTYPAADPSSSWHELDGDTYIPVTFGCARGAPVVAGSFCTNKFAIMGVGMQHGWESSYGSQVREDLLFLVCPPNETGRTVDATSCGSGYYGEFESELAHWVRRQWARSMIRSETLHYIVTVELHHIPASVRLEEFGKPIFVAIRLPRLFGEEGRYPLPLANGGHNALFGLVLRPDEATPPSQHGDEL